MITIKNINVKCLCIRALSFLDDKNKKFKEAFENISSKGHRKQDIGYVSFIYFDIIVMKFTILAKRKRESFSMKMNIDLFLSLIQGTDIMEIKYKDKHTVVKKRKGKQRRKRK